MKTRRKRWAITGAKWQECAAACREYCSGHSHLNQRYRSKAMHKRSLIFAFLTCMLGLSSAHAVPSPSSSGANAAIAGSTSSVAPQPVNGWWVAVPLVIGGILILEHEHRYHGHHYDFR